MAVQYTFQPWISINTNHQIVITSQTTSHYQILSILTIPHESLHLILGTTPSIHLSEQTVMAYLSQPFEWNSHLYRIVFVPPLKKHSQSVQLLIWLLKQFSTLMVSDVNSGIHRLCSPQRSPVNTYVMVNHKDIYLVQKDKPQIELIKQIKPPLMVQIAAPQSNLHLNIGNLNQAILHYQKLWQILINEQNWLLLCRKINEQYQKQQNTNQNEVYLSVMNDHKIAASKELQFIVQNILQNSSDYQCAAKTIQELYCTNQRNIFHHLKNMSSSICSQTHLTFDLLSSKKKQISSIISSFSLDPFLDDFVIFDAEKQLLHSQIQQLHSEKESLYLTIRQLQEANRSKKQQIEQFKNQLQLYCNKLTEMRQQQQKSTQLKQMLQSQKDQNRQLEQYISTLLEQCKQMRLSLDGAEQQIKEQQNKNSSLLECLQQLTRQSLQLHQKIDSQKTEIEEIKSQLAENNQIQSRALKSIQNQAEIRTRLHRYEQYVKELKLSLKSFKKLQCDKFNHILTHNYHQFQELQLRLNHTQQQLQNTLMLNQELAATLQRQKSLMSEFERFIRSNSYSFPIPQQSQQTSMTDRQHTNSPC